MSLYAKSIYAALAAIFLSLVLSLRWQSNELARAQKTHTAQAAQIQQLNQALQAKQRALAQLSIHSQAALKEAAEMAAAAQTTQQAQLKTHKALKELQQHDQIAKNWLSQPVPAAIGSLLSHADTPANDPN